MEADTVEMGAAQIDQPVVLSLDYSSQYSRPSVVVSEQGEIPALDDVIEFAGENMAFIETESDIFYIVKLPHRRTSKYTPSQLRSHFA